MSPVTWFATGNSGRRAGQAASIAYPRRAKSRTGGRGALAGVASGLVAGTASAFAGSAAPTASVPSPCVPAGASGSADRTRRESRSAPKAIAISSRPSIEQRDLGAARRGDVREVEVGEGDDDAEGRREHVGPGAAPERPLDEHHRDARTISSPIHGSMIRCAPSTSENSVRITALATPTTTTMPAQNRASVARRSARAGLSDSPTARSAR